MVISNGILEIEDPRFPPYLRLYQKEIRDLCENNIDIYKRLAVSVGEGKGNGFADYALKVILDPVSVIREIANKPGKYYEMQMPKVRRTRKGPSEEDLVDRKKEIERRIQDEAPRLRERVISTLIFNALRQQDTIRILDDIIYEEDFSLWQKIHLCDVETNSNAVKVFFEKFYREPTTLDKISCCFGNLKFLPDLTRNYNGFAMFPIHEPNVDVRSKIRKFLRNIPRVNVEGEDWFYAFIELCDNDPEDANAAALMSLLPNYEDVLYEKNMKRREERDKKRNIRKEEAVDTVEITEMRDKKDYAQFVKPPKYNDENVPLVLRDYQEELVAPALQGKNTLCVAPTGAGKTEISIQVAKNHFEQREKIGKKSRVVMIVPKVPLVDQQEQRFRKHFKATHIVNGFHGEMMIRGFERQKVFLGSDIIIMTAEILRNMLRSVREHERLYVVDISLLIIDEVHHTNKEHVYRRLLAEINEKPKELRPQILGLTATPLPTAQTNVKSSLEAIYRLMADTNCSTLSTVVRNIESLEKYVSKPDEEFFKLDPARENDDRFANNLKNLILRMMAHIEKEREALKKSPIGTTLKENEDIKFKKAPGKFLALTNVFRQALMRMANPLKKKPLIACDYFIALGTALSMNELMPSRYALKFLKEEMNSIRNKYAQADIAGFESLYDKIAADLESAVEEEMQLEEQNKSLKPIVGKLLEVLEKNFTEKPDSRCIIFVAERSTAKNLCQFLNLKGILGNNQVGYVTSSKSGTGQTSDQQTTVLKEFRNGIKKCIVSTSVLDEGLDVGACNLIIKYNTSSSAVSKIQRAGRARARNSKSIFLCLHDGIAESEYMAIVTGNMMRQCVKEMMRMGENNVKREVAQFIERKKREAEKQKQMDDMIAEELKGKSYDVICNLTNHYICDSDAIRVEGSHYVVADPTIWNRLTINTKIKTKAVDVETLVLGEVYCAGGQEIDQMTAYNQSCTCVGKLLKLGGAYLPHLQAGQLAFNQKGLTEATQLTYNTWAKVGREAFFIPPLSDADFRLMLNALNESDSEIQRNMMDQLDALAEKVGADVARNAEKKRHEREKREWIQNKQKEDFYEDDQAPISDESSSEDDEKDEQ